MTDQETVKTLKKANDVSRLIFAWIGLIFWFTALLCPKALLILSQFLLKHQ